MNVSSFRGMPRHAVSGERSRPKRAGSPISAARRLRRVLGKLSPLLHIRSKRFYMFAGMVLLTVVVWASAWEVLQREIPRLTWLQLKGHQWFSQLNPRTSRVQWVTVVEIDDDTFSSEPFNEARPLNRAALAQIVTEIATVQPAVIALDFDFSSPARYPWSDLPDRRRDDAALFAAIGKATSNHVPVVLSRVLNQLQDGTYREQPNIFRDADFPPGTYFGHINLPNDPRQMSLEMRARTWDGASWNNFPSFSQQIVNAYETVVHIKRRSEGNATIAKALRRLEFVYAGFLPTSEFDGISARDILQRKTQIIDRCRHKIVVIGATWHQRGKSIESLPSPIGQVAGVYLHANYVEAMNDGRFSLPLPEWLVIIVDVGAALFIYVTFLRRAPHRWLVFGLMGLLVGMAYVFATNIGRYMDFVPVLLLCLIHLGVEEVRHREPNREDRGVSHDS